ncbi:MAG TPA: helix-turn-helix domain-containing protein [Solirubrobacteraceae bacterium]|nr:helix-turn-helix domain-containing protein [Solirubrobacteraceae bacterium]
MSPEPRELSAEPRELSDAQALRALAHPVRLALLDALRARDELTASAAAELLGESPGNMSWHLGILARYGFVEETRTGTGRRRPWRLVDRTLRFSSAAPDAETAAAGGALEGALITRAFDGLEAWRRRRAEAPEWAEPSFLSHSIVALTPAELAEVSAAIDRVLQPYVDRALAARPPGTVAVRVVSFGHPV